MALDVRIDPEHGAATLAGAPLVFHCHYYNTALQQSIELGLGDAATPLLRDAAEQAVISHLRELGGGDAAKTLAAAGEVYSGLGFGVLELEGLGPQGAGTVRIRGSHYALGWLAVLGERRTPACHFAAGFVAGAVRAAYGHAAVQVRETLCAACGATHCELTVEVTP